MTQKNFAGLLKAAVVLALLCCAAIYALYVPAVANDARDAAAEYSALYWPALVFIELTAVPILWALVLAWLVASEIGRNNSFCRANAARLKTISLLALADVAYFWLGILVFWFGFNAKSGPMLLLSVMVGTAGIIFAVCAGALSHLTLKAAALREENDLTV